MIRRFIYTLLFLLVSLNIDVSANQKVTLQLRWDNQFQFAGYYAAQWQGFYEKEGLEVTILPALTAKGILSAVEEVGAGRAQFGIGASDILLARDNGVPLVLLASIFQHSASGFYTKQGVKLESPTDFLKLRVARKVNDLIDVELQTLLKAEGIDPEKVKPYPHQAGFGHLLDDKVDVIPGYVISIPFEAKVINLAINTFRPITYGIDFYGDSLFTNAQLIKEDPDLVQRFTKASLKGWDYAMNNREAVAKQITDTLPRTEKRDKPLEFNLFQSEGLVSLMNFPELDIGHVNPARWERMHEYLKGIGVLKNPIVIDEFIFNPEKINREKTEARQKFFLITISALLIGFFLAFFWIKMLRRSVNLKTKELLSSTKELRVNQERLSFVLDGGQLGYWDWNIETGEVVRNAYWSEMLGYTLEEIHFNDKQWSDLHHPDDKDAAWKSIQDHLEGRTPAHRIEYRMRTKDGQYKWILDQAKIVSRDSTGKPLRMSGTHTDVTERKQVEARLLESEEGYRVLVEGTDDLVTRVDNEGKFIFVNQTSEKIFGLKPEECIGLSAFDFVHPDDREITKQNFYDWIQNKIKFSSFENRQVSRTGEIFDMLWASTLLYDKSSKVIGVNAIARDITERKQAEKERERLQKQILKSHKLESIGTLAGGIAHDFNNLLYVVMGNISLALDDLKLDIEISENLKEAEKACIKAKELSAQLITFSKGGDPVKKRMPINGLLKDSVVSTLSGSTITPKISIADDIRQVNIDEDQIRQVVRNIVVNAKEAMDDNGQLTVSCENVDIAEKGHLTLNQGEYIKLSFKDQGCGILKENLEKIFDPYFSTKDMGTDKGQGLGLTVYYSIIQKHGGLIHVESERQTGSTFSVYLPAFMLKEPDLQKSEEKPVAQKSVKQPANVTGKILLMDDEKAIRKFLGKVINRLGYDVETCIEGKEAIEIYTKAMKSKEPFDVVILDLTNKIGMGGQETMTALLELDRDAKGIIITGYSDDPVVANFREYGFSGFIIKPATRDELSKVINEVIL